MSKQRLQVTADISTIKCQLG
ncbi:hypothetical protein EZS27_044072, partial [termite gut metagenome]